MTTITIRHYGPLLYPGDPITEDGDDYIIPSTGERIPKKGTMISCDGFGLGAMFIHDEIKEVSNDD